jgi:hypothetical protein
MMRVALLLSWAAVASAQSEVTAFTTTTGFIGFEERNNAHRDALVTTTTEPPYGSDESNFNAVGDAVGDALEGAVGGAAVANGVNGDPVNAGEVGNVIGDVGGTQVTALLSLSLSGAIVSQCACVNVALKRACSPLLSSQVT